MTALNGKPCPKCSGNEWLKSGDCAPCNRERQKRRYLRDPEKAKKAALKWHRENPDKVKEKAGKWRKNHPDKERERQRLWIQKNPDKKAAKNRRRREREAQAGGGYTAAEWETLVKHYGKKCLRCGRDDLTLTADHVIPVSKGGTSNINNIQPLCKGCNSVKGNQIIDYRS